MVDVLIRHGADINCRNKFGETALIIAAKKGLNNVVSKLTEQGADVTCSDQHEHTALYYATESGFNEIVEILLMAGLKPERKIPMERQDLKDGNQFRGMQGKVEQILAGKLDPSAVELRPLTRYLLALIWNGKEYVDKSLMLFEKLLRKVDQDEDKKICDDIKELLTDLYLLQE